MHSTRLIRRLARSLAALAVVLAPHIAAGQSAPAADSTTKLPIVPARTISFTTDEGTWMALDVSPDGRTIVFELLGDIYTVRMEGGEARRLTSGMAWDAMPAFSPDGKEIVGSPGTELEFAL